MKHALLQVPICTPLEETSVGIELQRICGLSSGVVRVNKKATLTFIEIVFKTNMIARELIDSASFILSLGDTFTEE